MKVTRIADARPYDAKDHFSMVALRLQGPEIGGNGFATLGMSHFMPGGGAKESSSDIEKIYFALVGEVTIVTDEGDTVLRAFDSCWLAAGERRSIINRTTMPASMLVILPSK